MEIHRDRILINARFRLAGRPSGVQRYAAQIACRLEDRARLAAPAADRGRLAGHAWEQLILPGQARCAGVVWSPANTGPLAVPRQVLTLHDAGVIEHPEWFSPAFAAWYRFLIPRLARRVLRVTTVSQFARRRILAALNLPADRVDVIYPGVGAQFRPAAAERIAAVCRKYGLDGRYFLWVGALEPRKNLPRLLAAWRRVWDRQRDLRLALVGSAPQRGSVFRTGASAGLPPGVTALGYADDEDLPALYSGALALAMPSLQEGFGLPALEAAACGTPAIITPTTGVLEVLEDSAAVVDAGDVEGIAAALERLAGDDGWRRNLGERAAARSAAYTWERSADAVYRTLLAALEGASTV